MPKLSQYTSLKKPTAPGVPSKKSQDVPGLEETKAWGPEVSKLVSDYSKRTAQHGARLFRWPDGSLRDTPPPPNPYAVASRRRWVPLVLHCRTSGSHAGISKTGQSLRYGVGVPHSAHGTCLAAIGLRPETDEHGHWHGYDPTREAPLKDPTHPFNTVYKHAASQVLNGRRGRLLPVS
uniref:Uncharacterized protein n=1 Tax=Auxenochlorella protothecoides TaxID=3075 RepID=A0A1D2AH44_AUXPR